MDLKHTTPLTTPNEFRTCRSHHEHHKQVRTTTTSHDVTLSLSEFARGVSVAKGPRSSLRVTVPQGAAFGGPEEGVVEVGQDECQGVEMNVEDVEERKKSKDDCMNGR